MRQIFCTDCKRMWLCKYVSWYKSEGGGTVYWKGVRALSYLSTTSGKQSWHRGPAPAMRQIFWTDCKRMWLCKYVSWYKSEGGETVYWEGVHYHRSELPLLNSPETEGRHQQWDVPCSTLADYHLQYKLSWFIPFIIIPGSWYRISMMCQQVKQFLRKQNHPYK